MLSRFFAAKDVFGKCSYDPPKGPAYEHGELRRRLQGRAEKLARRRRDYILRVEGSIAVALAVILGIFSLDLDPSNSGLHGGIDNPDVVVLEDIVQTRQVEKPPPPPRPPVPIEVPNDEEIEEEALDIDAEIDFDEIAELPPPPPAVAQEQEEEPDFFVVVEEMPEIVGGFGSISEHLVYPEIARKAQISGTVVVQIIVTRDGTPSNPRILKSVNKVLDDAARDAVMKLRFIPGKQRGRPVPVQMAFPVRFTLDV